MNELLRVTNLHGVGEYHLLGVKNMIFEIDARTKVHLRIYFGHRYKKGFVKAQMSHLFLRNYFIHFGR